MNRKEIQKKYPEHKIIFEPLENCPRCKGNGEFINGSKEYAPCFCTCIEYFRKYPISFNDALNATAKRGLAELRSEDE